MSQGCRCLCALALVLSSSAAFRADGQAPVGSEFAVAFDLLYHADSPAAAMSTNGSFVVVWESYSYSSPSGRDIAAQRYSSAGTPLAGFMVAGGNGTDSQPAVTSDAAGNFVVAWRGPYPGGYKVFAQRYSSAGDALGGRIQVTFVASLSHDPDLAATAAGDFVVVWRADATYSVPAGIVATRFSSSGTPLTGEFAVSTSTSGSQGHPAVAVGPNGDFVVVWEGFSGPTQNIFGRRFSSAGAPLGGELRVNSLTAAASYDPHVVLDSAGNFIVVWRSFGGDGAGNAISARRFSSSGAAIGNEFVLNAYTTGDQSRPSLAADPSGDFVAVWESVGQDAGGVGVFGRRFSSSGTPQGGEFRVNTYTSQNQFIPAVGRDASGAFVVVWGSNQDSTHYNVFGQRYCGPLTSVSIALQGSNTACTGGSGGTLTVTDLGGSGNTQQWYYRTVSMGAAVPLLGSETGNTYLLKASSFPGPGLYYLVSGTTPAQCGSFTLSNEVAVTITGDAMAPTVTAPATTKTTQTLCL